MKVRLGFILEGNETDYDCVGGQTWKCYKHGRVVEFRWGYILMFPFFGSFVFILNQYNATLQHWAAMSRTIQAICVFGVGFGYYPVRGQIVMKSYT